jgi:hypothetical protein
MPQAVAPPAVEAAGAEDRAILRTVTYAALFQFPLSLAELERRLMDAPLDLAAIRRRLGGAFLRQRIGVTEGLVHPRGREAWISLRRERQERAEALLSLHRRALRLLGRFPFVRLVALSGGCAHGNATDQDVDVFLVVKRGRAWCVFGALLLLAKAAGLRRTLCLNYIVDEDALALPERDVFTAAEIVGLRPLRGQEGYTRFLRANAWVEERFPNFVREAAAAVGLEEAGAGRFVEALLECGPAPILEWLSRRLFGAHLRRKARGNPGVVLGAGRLKLHLRDHRPELLAAYDKALQEAEA